MLNFKGNLPNNGRFLQDSYRQSSLADYCRKYLILLKSKGTLGIFTEKALEKSEIFISKALVVCGRNLGQIYGALQTA